MRKKAKKILQNLVFFFLGPHSSVVVKLMPEQHPVRFYRIVKIKTNFKKKKCLLTKNKVAVSFILLTLNVTFEFSVYLCKMMFIFLHPLKFQ